MTALFLFVAAAWALLLAAAVRAEKDATRFLSARVRPAGADGDSEGAPEVDVVVPARDEEDRLAPLLASLLLQERAPRAIVVVDDRSTDGTAAVVDRFAATDRRVVRIDGEGPPPGWTGKTAALTRGYRETRAPWILFVDADVRLDPATLWEALDEARARGWDGISLWGRWVVPGLWPRLLQCAVGSLVRGAHPIERVNDPSLPGDAFVNGQFLLIRREAFDAAGGWESVRSSVLEDLAFAKRAKRLGRRIGLLCAPDRMRVEPYARLREAWEGYGKNFLAGAGGTAKAAALAAAVVLFSIVPWLALAVGLAGGIGPAPTAAAGAAVAATLLYRLRTAATFHHPPADALLHPVAYALVVGLIARAVLRRLAGRPARWKGREVG